MNRQHLPIALVTCLAVSCAVHADTLVLRGGKEINGTFLGATARQIEFLPESGKPIKVSVDTVEGVNFLEMATAAQPSPPAPTAAPRRPVLLPAGTMLRVRTIDNIDVDYTKAGTKFRANLDDPILSGGDVIIPRGAPVVLLASKVQQGGKMKGSDLIELKAISISVSGRWQHVVTSIAQAQSSGEGKKTAGKVFGGAGLGAIIGGIAGGGKGAGIGALVGGATGTVVAASGEPHLKVPAETRLEFQLAADWKVQ